MFITISHTNSEPLYKQVIEQIKEEIIKGELKPGSALPSIRSLAKDLRISVITIKKAYSDLEDEGYIVTRPGLGSFVVDISKQDIKKIKKEELEKKLSEIVKEAKMYEIEEKELLDIIKRVGDEWWIQTY